jgi:hypothetical protein
MISWLLIFAAASFTVTGLVCIGWVAGRNSLALR